MNKDKQIEEIKAIILEDCGGDCENCEFHNKPVCYDNFIANRLYNAGYRKASDVAREIFEGVETLINLICLMTGLNIRGLDKYIELKKKYESEEIK